MPNDPIASISLDIPLESWNGNSGITFDTREYSPPPPIRSTYHTFTLLLVYQHSPPGPDSLGKYKERRGEERSKLFFGQFLGTIPRLKIDPE